MNFHDFILIEGLESERQDKIDACLKFKHEDKVKYYSCLIDIYIRYINQLKKLIHKKRKKTLEYNKLEIKLKKANAKKSLYIDARNIWKDVNKSIDNVEKKDLMNIATQKEKEIQLIDI